VIRNFHDQQIHKKARYQIMGRRYQENVQKLQVEKQKLLVVSLSNKRCVDGFSPMSVSLLLCGCRRKD
jgi:hypothetical protein